MNVGDEVKIVSKDFDPGHTGKIIDHMIGSYPYRVLFNGQSTWFREDELESVGFPNNLNGVFEEHSSGIITNFDLGGEEWGELPYNPSREELLQSMKDDVREALTLYRTPRQADGNSHYSRQVVEPMDLAYLNDLTPSELKVVKYATRARFKNGDDDVFKAIDILFKMLQYEYGYTLEGIMEKLNEG